MNKSEKYAIKCMYVLNVSDCSKTKTREGIEREREKGKGGLEGKREREREKRGERQNFGQSFVKEGGALKSPLENSGEFCLLVLHYVPCADFMGTDQNQDKKKGE